SAVLSVRVTHGEFRAVSEKANALGFQASHYLRTLLLDGSQAVQARPSSLNLEVASKIHSISANLDRLVHLSDQRAMIPSQIGEMVDSLHASIQTVVAQLRGGGK
ncbi:MAG: hypothetical protein WCR20_21485, partial [Verrucomicrobiota bacterium]